MTTWRLFDGAAGRPGVASSGTQPPSSPTSYSGNFLAGVSFSVTGQMMWLNGYYWWVPPGGDTGPQKFALWNRYAASTQQLVTGSVVTSGALTAGIWNFVPLSTPVQLAPGAEYVACTGWSAVNGFPDTQNQFGGGDPYAAGIVNGPLTAWSDPTNGGSNNWPTSYATPQGLFSVAGTDPSVIMPDGGSNSSNFWVDVSVSDIAPSSFSGPWSLWPNMADAEGFMPDLGRNYVIATEVILSQACQLNAIRYYSGVGCSQLATDIALWDVSTQLMVSGTHVSSPSWSGAAASGWLQANYGSVPVIPAGDYKIAIFNGAATPAPFNVTTPDYFVSPGFGASGLTAGPISCPGAAAAASPGQCTYQDTTGSPSFIYPDLYVASQGQNYWIDALFTPAPATATPSPLVVPQAAVMQAANW